MKTYLWDRRIRRGLLATLAVLIVCASSFAQRKRKVPVTPSKPPAEQSQTDLAKLRDDYVKATRDYKASLQRLLASYEESLKKAEDRRDQIKKLSVDGLVSQREVEQAEDAVTSVRLKVTEAQTQIAGADTQIAQAMIEVEGEKEIAKLGPIRPGSLIRTTSFIRYNGVGAWALAQAPKIEAFFQQTFKRPLPIAVFGQGSIHNQWRLDHRNAMDISLNPDGVEGQALINFLQQNGIPFSAFRTAIPGVATGPHIHIGRPSHRY
jgi:hypothetical protein